MSIIGKIYRVFDNSYMLNLSSSDYNANDHKKLPILAACAANQGKYELTQVISEPYTQVIDGKMKIFVNVVYREHIYRVLYSQGGLDAKPYFAAKGYNRYANHYFPSEQDY